MSKAQRDKGLRGELEVTHILSAAGLVPHGLDGQGDHLVVGEGRPLHVEVKRQETIRILAWCRQAEAEAQDGAIPVVVFRPSREPWRAALLLDDLIGLIP